MIFDRNWEEIADKAESLKNKGRELRKRVEAMSQEYEQLIAQHAICLNKIKVTLSQCSDYGQRLMEAPEKNRLLREAFDSSDGILVYLGRVLEYEKAGLKRDNGSKDIHFHFYSELVSVLASKMNLLAQQLNELQKYCQEFDKDMYQEQLVQELGGMPERKLDTQFPTKSDRLTNQISRFIRDLNRKYKKKGLSLYYQYSISDDSAKFRRLKQQVEDLTVELMLLKNKEEETENMLTRLENIHQQQKQDLKSDPAYMQYAAVYSKLRLIFTHDQLVRLNSSVYTKIEYTQLVKGFCNRVRDALITPPIQN